MLHCAHALLCSLVWLSVCTADTRVDTTQILGSRSTLSIDWRGTHGRTVGKARQPASVHPSYQEGQTSTSTWTPAGIQARSAVAQMSRQRAVTALARYNRQQYRESHFDSATFVKWSQSVDTLASNTDARYVCARKYLCRSQIHSEYGRYDRWIELPIEESHFDSDQILSLIHI